MTTIINHTKHAQKQKHDNKQASCRHSIQLTHNLRQFQIELK